MEEKFIESTIDAFIALRDIPDEAVVDMIKKPVQESLTEGKTYDIYNNADVSAAQDFFDNEVNIPAKETELEVIDVDADTVEHLKDKDAYIGQAILRCNRCKSNMFVDMDKLEPNEEDPTLYNVETECPHCHTESSGFELIGQVGKVDKQKEIPEEESAEETSEEEVETIEEPEVEEESADEEELVIPNSEESEDVISFDNDAEEESTQEEQEEESEENSNEEETIEVDSEIEKEQEKDGMETSESEEEIEKEITTKDGKKLKLKLTKKLGDVYEESFEADEDDIKESLVEEVTPDYVENHNAEEAWMMNNVISHMNDEDAYFSSGWLYVWPDQCSREECDEYFSDQEDFEDLKGLYERVYRRYHSGGLYEAPADVEAYARETDKKLGLEPIESLKRPVKVEALEKECKTISEFFKQFNHPERIGKVLVTKPDYDVFDESKAPLFEGMCDDLSPYIQDCKFDTFNVGDGFLTCNIDSEETSNNNLRNFLNKFDNDKSEKILLWDLGTCDQCFQGNKQDAIDKFGDCSFFCAEAPKILVIKVEPEAAAEKDLVEIKADPKSDIDKFVDKVYQVNQLDPYKKQDPQSDEYWIAEGIENKQDLPSIYKQYIKPIDSKQLTEEFKKLTDFKEATFSVRKKLTEAEEKPEVKKITSNIWTEIVDYPTMKEFAKGSKWGVADPEDGEGYFNRYASGGKFFGRVVKGKKHLKYIDEIGNITVYDADMKPVTEAYHKLDRDELTYAVNDEWQQAMIDLGKTASVEDIANYLENTALSDMEFDSNLLRRILKNKIIKDRVAGEPVAEDIESEPIVESYKEDFRSFKTRKELSEAITECKNNTQPYTVRRSIIEGYRYDLIFDHSKYNPDDYKSDDLEARADEYEEEQAVLRDLAAADAEDKKKLTENDAEFELEIVDDNNAEEVDAEITDKPAPSTTSTDIVPEGMSELEIDVIRKIQRIAQDIKQAIKDNYDLDVDPALIVADILQDLKLISHSISPEDLEKTASNKATIEMFKSYEAMYELIDNLMSAITGQTIESTPESRLAQAVQMLDSQNFSTEAIFEGIASTKFLEAVQAGMVPYLDVDEIPQLEEEVDFPTEQFDHDMNEYFKEAYNSNVSYITESGHINTDGSVILEGKITSDDDMGRKDLDIRFELVPFEESLNEELTLTEKILQAKYKVSNNLSEELFEFALN